MDQDQKVWKKPPKLDLKAIIALAPKEPEPRLIAEIYAEVWAFPFRVRKIRRSGGPASYIFPVGAELMVINHLPERENNHWRIHEVDAKRGITDTKS